MWILAQTLWITSEFRLVWSLPDLLTRHSSAIANQESLSGLETEMRKIEGIIKEIIDEMSYLKNREERFTLTNGTS